LIDSDGEQLGIISIGEARERAEIAGLDLVEVAPNADPPVCRIMDYGKYKYQLSKKAHDAKKKQSVVSVKEVKVSPKTQEHDLSFKIRHMRRFLENGDKVKVTMVFRGREITHTEIGRDVLEKIIGEIEEFGTVEVSPKLEGRHMVMIIAPKK
jgi:translation initiation factor IF-3